MTQFLYTVTLNFIQLDIITRSGMAGDQLLYDLMSVLMMHFANLSLTQNGSTMGLNKISNVFGYFKVTLQGVMIQQGNLGGKGHGKIIHIWEQG